jgi:hypothetical protein
MAEQDEKFIRKIEEAFENISYRWKNNNKMDYNKI